ncbi:MAG: tetratricopeptide repeat protein, partial [Akkermansia sp.]|nr:tetratricopeptide repeat protein [Akkermansia sp.]
MVALAMNGFTSRSVLFSLVTSVALSFAPQVTAQETDGVAIAAQESARRQQAMREAMQHVQEARTAYTAGRYSDAVDFYRQALAVVPKAPATEKQVKFIRDSLADALVAKGMDYRKVGRLDEAVSFMEEALTLSPGHKFAAHELKKTQDPVRTNPALTPQHVGDVAEVKRLLELAYGHYDLGNYDKAHDTFQSVLRIDPYNTAARRGMELVQNRRISYLSKAHDAYRVKMLGEVDKMWEEPVPDEQMVDVAAAAETGAVVQQDADTENRIVAAIKEMVIPQIVFEDAGVRDVIAAIQGQIARFEAKGIGAGRRINVVPNFGAADSQGYKDIMSRSVNLNLNDISVFDLLNILDSQLGITHYITPLGVELSYSGKDFGPLVDRAYTVPPHFFDAETSAGGDDEDDDDFGSSSRVVVRRVNPVEALKGMGISFPEGANARYDASTRLLTVLNTAHNQEEIESLISMPMETDRTVVLNIMAMEVDETDLNELGFEWLFNFNIGPKALFGSGTKEEIISDLTSLPTVQTDVALPDTGYSATGGLRSGRSVLTTDNIDSLISLGRAGLYPEDGRASLKAPGIFSFRGIWNSGDVTMIMRGAAQKKGTDIMSNPRIVLTPGRDEQVVFANVNEIFYPETYAAPQIATSSFGIGSSNNNNNNNN